MATIKVKVKKISLGMKRQFNPVTNLEEEKEQFKLCFYDLVTDMEINENYQLISIDEVNETAVLKLFEVDDENIINN